MCRTPRGGGAAPVWAALCLLLSQASPARADDASFFGDGATVYALKESRISMVKEEVVVRYDPHGPRHLWVADCTFTFASRSDREIEVQMGFPDWRPFGDYAEESPWAIREFQVEVDGQAVQAQHKVVDRKAAGGIAPLPPGVEAHYDGAYTWPVRFAPRATVLVHNRYTFGGFLSNGPFRLVYQDRGFPKRSVFWRAGGRNRKVSGCDLDDGLAQRVQYIVTTARTWGGSIGEADIAIQIPPRVLPHQLVPTPAATSIGGGMVRWHRSHWTPDQEIALYVATPYPEEGCRRPPLFDTEQQARAWIRFARANGIQRDAVEAVRDAYLARRGHRFADEARNRYYAAMVEAPDGAVGAPIPAGEARIMALLDAFAGSLPAAAP